MSLAWGIVPLHRPADLPNVIANARRQSVDFRLCVVENGDALGACKRAGFWPDSLLRSAPHQSAARNTALEWIRSHGGGFFFTMDADDWYGPSYLAELLKHRRKANVVGKRRHLILLRNGLHLFDARSASKPTDILHGACLAGRAEEAVPFPDLAVGEDSEWCRAMAAEGATLFATSARNYIYVRTGAAHTWKRSDLELRMHMGPGFLLRGGQPKFIPLPTADEYFATI